MLPQSNTGLYRVKLRNLTSHDDHLPAYSTKLDNTQEDVDSPPTHSYDKRRGGGEVVTASCGFNTWRRKDVRSEDRMTAWSARHFLESIYTAGHLSHLMFAWPSRWPRYDSLVSEHRAPRT